MFGDIPLWLMGAVAAVAAAFLFLGDSTGMTDLLGGFDLSSLLGGFGQ